MDRERNQGGRNGAAKFTEAQVIAIRERWDAGESPRKIQQEYAEFGHYVSIETIRRIGRRETWGWLMDGGTFENPPPISARELMESQASAERVMDGAARDSALELLNAQKVDGLSPEAKARREDYLGKK